MTGDIMTISRLRMGTDGPGLSTLVTFFGCPLQCKYCANWFCHEEETPRKSYTPENIVKSLKQDDIYFKMTGGGIVFGGGEPLLYAAFIHEVCQQADPLWKKRIETSLCSSWNQIELLVADIDEWIVDIKDMNPKIYKKYTKISNDIVLQNLEKLIKVVPKEKILIRVPLIPSFNSYKDIEQSIKILKNMGFSRIEQFEYFKIMRQSKNH